MEIVVIKLGAAGDVVRTLPIISALKEKYPSSKLTLITKKDIAELMKSSFIDAILTIPLSIAPAADKLYNFDMDEDALKLASEIKSSEKYGFYAQGSYPSAYNKGAEYYLNTVFDDDLKRNNKKTYQEMMFEVAELPLSKKPYTLHITSVEKEKAQDFLRLHKIDSGRLIGIHMGASSRWPSKVWSKERLKEFIKRITHEGYSVVLFGGPNEVDEHAVLSKSLEQEGVRFYRNNPLNSKREFMALVSQCGLVLCSDSFALHVAIGLHLPTIALFFCTSPHEVEGYGYVTKLSSPLLYDFFPEKSDVFSRELVESISVDKVIGAVHERLPSKV